MPLIGGADGTKKIILNNITIGMLIIPIVIKELYYSIWLKLD